MASNFFPYRLDHRWDPLFALLGVKESDGIHLSDEGDLVATYGRFRVETTLDNVARTEVTGPHRWYTAVGLRLSFTDDGVTFGTNHHLGVSIVFVEKVPRVIGFNDHSILWVSVEDPEGLAAAIGR